MIKKYNTIKQETFQRLQEKTKEQTFINFIYKNTNLSKIECEIVFKEFSHKFSSNNRQNLKPMQTFFIATKINAKHGKKLEEVDFDEIKITLHDQEDDEIRKDSTEFCKQYNFKQIDNLTAVRRNKLLRITNEALEQECVLTEEDLAYKIFSCGRRTIQRDIKEFKKSNIMIPTRGVVCDIGKSLSHKVEAIRTLTEGKEINEIARKIYHTPKAIERYWKKFLQIVSALENGLKDPEISFLTSTSYLLLKEYKKLYKELKEEGKLEWLKETETYNSLNINKLKGGEKNVKKE